MNTVRIKHKIVHELAGQFDFTVGPTIILAENFQPVKPVTFYFSPEWPQDLQCNQSAEEVYEMIGEKLKQDFIKFLKTHG